MDVKESTASPYLSPVPPISPFLNPVLITPQDNHSSAPVSPFSDSYYSTNFSKKWKRLKNKLTRKTESKAEGSFSLTGRPDRSGIISDAEESERSDSVMTWEVYSKNSKSNRFRENPNSNVLRFSEVFNNQCRSSSLPPHLPTSSDSDEGGRLVRLKLNAERWRAKRANLIKAIPSECMKQWKENSWRELNRFTKLSAVPNLISTKGETTPWIQRIFQDLQRSRKLVICGDINESFEFPRFAFAEDRETLVQTCMKFLNASLDDLISEACPSLGSAGRSALATKAVNQSLISVCQDFINEPYFKILKCACERYSLTPSGSHDPIEIGDHKPGVTIRVERYKMNVHVCRTFKTLKIADMEVEPSEFVFGFKRTYSIDMLGGPPKICPPIWLAKNERKVLKFSSSSSSRLTSPVSKLKKKT